jgi:hypothetical protein
MTPLHLLSLPGDYAIAQLPASAAIPEWATRGALFSITRTTDELSIVCRDQDVPLDLKVDRGWRCLRVVGKLEFTMVGVLASVCNPLAEIGVAVFVLSTFDTDFLLVKNNDIDRAAAALERAGHRVLSDLLTYLE